MSKYNFKIYQRYAVWKAFQGICQWCRQPVDFQNFHVDHVLPEELLSEPNRLKNALSNYGLIADFNINDYENWIPAHPFCNQKKSDKDYLGAPFIRDILDACIQNKETEQLIESTLRQQPKKAELLAKVQAAIQANFLNIQELQNFLLGKDLMDSEDEDLINIRKELEHQLDYQSGVKYQQLMDMVKEQTWQILADISQTLGAGWTTYTRTEIFDAEYTGQTIVPYGITASSYPAYNVSICLVQNIVDKNLIIDFIEIDENGDKQKIDTLTVETNNGMDWNKFRNILKHHYKIRIAKKIKQRLF